MRRKYIESIEDSTTALAFFRNNLQSFAYWVGCPQTNQDPQLNIAALRLYHSTQMPFFSKLQNDLQKQIEINTKQQEIITALVFRHLLENLPLDPYSGQRKGTARWQAYWFDMVVKAIQEARAGRTGHPLEGLIDDGVVDPTGNITDATRADAKGLVYRQGYELYGILSENIHKYQAEGGETAYAVRTDQWDQSVRSILNRLVPDNIDPNTGVMWATERNRFVETFTCCQCHRTTALPTCQNPPRAARQSHPHPRCGNCTTP